jgi:hypothetical protein
MKFDQWAPVFSWTIDLIVKSNLEIQFASFWICLKNLIRIYLNFYFGLLGFELINGFDPALKP